MRAYQKGNDMVVLSNEINGNMIYPCKKAPESKDSSRPASGVNLPDIEMPNCEECKILPGVVVVAGEMPNWAMKHPKHD